MLTLTGSAYAIIFFFYWRMIDMKKAILCLIFTCLLVLAGCGDNNNDNGTGGNVPPTITSMTPNEVSRGQINVQGHIIGTNLNGATSVNLGDGITVQTMNVTSSTEINVQFSVAAGTAAGPRTITVTTSRGTATSSTAFSVINNRAPTPKISVSPLSGAKNTTFTFNASDSTDAAAPASIRSYLWNFGDNETANGRIVEHKYAKPGTYTVTLTVTDDSGATNQATTTIEVAEGRAPVVRYTILPESGDIFTTFTFDASASKDKDGTIQAFDWDFGDGEKASGPVVTHKFSKAGVFGVVLTETDNDGIESALEKDLRVEEFDEQIAKDEIRFVLEVFFKRFGELEHLSADVIVEHWSSSPDCPGREREIRIIENQQETLKSTSNEITEPIDVFIHPSHVSANATVVARFQFTRNDGTTGDGTVEHDFTMKFEDDEWQVCNFKLATASEPMQHLFSTDEHP
jgi:PKD repeat protein